MLLSCFKFYCYKRKVTFEDVYTRWSNEAFEDLADSTKRTWRAAFSHCKELHNVRFKDIRVWDLEQVIKSANVGNATKVRIKCLFNKLYKYAIKHELVSKNESLYCDVPSARRQINREPFSKEEILCLWENLDVPFVDMILVGIYTGFRPSELTLLKKSDIDLKENFICGGMKTAAGRKREVPIHSEILPVIKKKLIESDIFLFEKDNACGLNYYEYRNRFNKIMKVLGMSHYPHDTRHTFVTLAKEFDANEYVLKRVVGHVIPDITEGVYTHRKREVLQKEIDKIKVKIC